MHHYIKNLLILFPLACSGMIFDRDKLISSLIGFAAFCLMSSAIYIINDLMDAGRDLNHPAKRNRPIAAGLISPNSAIVFAVLLIIISFVINFLSFSYISIIPLAAYLILNLLYSFGLKDVPILDIVILASGFLIRIVYGSIITDIEISNWLYLVVISGAFYLSLGKRRNELKKTSHFTDALQTRKVISKYSIDFLDRNMYVFMALVDVFYALWTVDNRTIVAYNSSNLIWTVPIVIIIFLRYSMTIEGDSDGDPVEVLLHDKPLIILCILYLAAMFGILYL